MTITYSNPRMHAVVANWPSGGKRVTATFSIETHPTRGQRGVRVTTGAPKKLTYVEKARIVDGSDGRIYIAEYNNDTMISIMCGDFKGWELTANVWKHADRLPELRALFDVPVEAA